MIMQRFFKYTIGSCLQIGLAAMVLVGAGGCSIMEDPSVDCPQKSEGVSFKFHVNTVANMSGIRGVRSDDKNHDEEWSQQPAVEDMVNINDFAFYIFVSTTAGDENPALLYSCTDLENDETVSFAGAMGVYDIHCMVTEERMKSIFGDNYDINSTVPVYLRIMAIANTHADRNSTSGTLAPQGDDSSTLESILNGDSGAQSLTFDLKKEAPAFPMYGLGQYQQSSLSVLSDSSPEDPFSLGSLTLLRAVAKVRVADNIKRNPGEEYPKIGSATLTYTSATGYSLPGAANNYVDGTQVHNVNIPDQTVTENTTISLSIGNESVTIDSDGTKVTQNTEVLYGYCPEQTFSGDLPCLTINILRSAADTRQYTVPLSGYNGNSFVWQGSEGKLLRNHIYTLSVGLTPDDKIQLIVRLLPWSTPEIIKPVFPGD